MAAPALNLSHGPRTHARAHTHIHAHIHTACMHVCACIHMCVHIYAQTCVRAYMGTRANTPVPACTLAWATVILRPNVTGVSSSQQEAAVVPLVLSGLVTVSPASFSPGPSCAQASSLSAPGRCRRLALAALLPNIALWPRPLLATLGSISALEPQPRWQLPRPCPPGPGPIVSCCCSSSLSRPFHLSSKRGYH